MLKPGSGPEWSRCARRRPVPARTCRPRRAVVHREAHRRRQLVVRPGLGGQLDRRAQPDAALPPRGIPRRRRRGRARRLRCGYLRPVTVSRTSRLGLVAIPRGTARAVSCGVHCPTCVGRPSSSGCRSRPPAHGARTPPRRIGSNTVHGESDSTGTTLRPDPVVVWFIGIALVGAILSAAFFVIFVPRGGVDIPFSAPGRRRAAYS